MKIQLEWDLPHDTLSQAERTAIMSQMARAAYFFASDIRLQRISEPADGVAFGPAQRDHNLCADMATARELLGVAAACELHSRVSDGFDTVRLSLETNEGELSSYRGLDEALDTLRDGIAVSFGDQEQVITEAQSSVSTYGR